MPDAVSAGRAVSAIIRKGYRPRALELIDKPAIDHVRPKAAFTFPSDAGAIVLVELDGEPDGMEAGVLRCGAVCEEEGALEVIVARDDADRERLWQTRRLVLASRCARRTPSRSPRTSSCRLGQSPRCCAASTPSAAGRRCSMATFGHAGDGNLHVNVLTDENDREPAVRTRIDEALGEIFRAALDLGGTLSGEHGIGIAKAKYMAWEQSAEVIDWQKRLKPALGSAGAAQPGQDLRRRRY